MNMGLIDDVIDSVRFKDTIFVKKSSDLEYKYYALKRLTEEYPKNNDLKNELYFVKKGLYGENEILYQLKKSNIGMYVLRDVKVKYRDLTAQIDYIIITPVYTYYVECKNLIGNIIVTDKGDFIREYTINGKKIRKGMYSPFRQVEAQREVIRKIWESNTSPIKRLFASKKFKYYRRVLVVIANKDAIVNTNKAPKEMKYKILRVDALIDKIEYDINHKGDSDYQYSKKNMEEIAQSYINMSVKENIDYYEFYKNKYCNSNVGIEDNLKDRLIKLRKNRSHKLKIPAYYIFTNYELDKLIEKRPKTIEELKNSNILSPIKIKIHGYQILDELNRSD